MTQGNEFAALVGIDWSEALELAVIVHQPEAIEAWARSLQQRFEGKPIAVCLEQKGGPLIYGLCKYDFLVLFPVNPQTVAKYRQAFGPSRAKNVRRAVRLRAHPEALSRADDPTDGKGLVELLLKHQDKLQPWHRASVEVRKLQQLVEWRRKLGAEILHTTNRLSDVLKGYFPQVLDWFEHRDTLVFCDFLTQWSTLQAVQPVSGQELRQFFIDPNSRYAKGTADCSDSSGNSLANRPSHCCTCFAEGECIGQSITYAG